MADPVPGLTYAAVFSAYAGLILDGTATIATFADCQGLDDLVSGVCADVVHDLARLIIVGTIPGAPFEINLIFGAIGLACRLTLVVWLIEKGGWVAILGLVAGVIAALVAWLS
jgi:hypothetical protein